jgi:hypothetical protein
VRLTRSCVRHPIPSCDLIAVSCSKQIYYTFWCRLQNGSMACQVFSSNPFRKRLGGEDPGLNGACPSLAVSTLLPPKGLPTMLQPRRHDRPADLTLARCCRPARSNANVRNYDFFALPRLIHRRHRTIVKFEFSRGAATQATRRMDEIHNLQRDAGLDRYSCWPASGKSS